MKYHEWCWQSLCSSISNVLTCETMVKIQLIKHDSSLIVIDVKKRRILTCFYWRSFQILNDLTVGKIKLTHWFVSQASRFERLNKYLVWGQTILSERLPLGNRTSSFLSTEKIMNWSHKSSFLVIQNEIFFFVVIWPNHISMTFLIIVPPRHTATVACFRFFVNHNEQWKLCWNELMSIWHRRL